MDIVRKHVVFHGRVQGVGFRYTARLAAKQMGVTGWVRNEYDGTVVMEIQGRPILVNQVLMRLNTDSYIRIEWMDSKEIPVVEGEKSFRVTF